MTKSLRQLNLSKLFSDKSTLNTSSIDVEKIKTFVSSPTHLLYESDIKTFISIQDSLYSNSLEVTTLLTEMILNSNQYSLPPLAKTFEKVITDSFLVHQISAKEYGTLVNLILTRALEIFPQTLYISETGEVEEHLGFENLIIFEDLLKYISDDDENFTRSQNIFFQLLSRSGSIKQAENVLEKMVTLGVSLTDRSIDEFFSTLERYLFASRNVSHLSRIEYNNSVKEILFKFRKFLLSQNITPSMADLLLEFSAYLDEFYGVMNMIEDSSHCDEILSKCQPKIIQTAVRCSIPHSHWAELESESSGIVCSSEKEVLSISPDSPIIRKKLIYTKAMATMFGILDRFKDTSAGLTTDALDQCLILSARLGNSGGMYKALSLRLQQNLSNSLISQDILSKLFDAFPINQGGVNFEKRKSSSLWIINDAIIADSARDEAILFHLRSNIDPFVDSKVYIKYLSALGRCLRVDLLSHEWESIILPPMINNNDIEHAYYPDIVISLLSAFKTANSIPSALVVLDSLLQSSTRSMATYRHAICILEKVLTHEVLPLFPTLNHLTKWLINNRDATNWSDSDVNQILSDTKSIAIKPSDLSLLITDSSVKPDAVGKLLSELVLQVRRGKDIDMALKHLDQMFK
ncbi:uncharacterized protein SAPINGB_P004779 [Magnusiomyces paraingens]|uniref:ATPase expression protein 1 n=1 Tax=Magnusiomyces paraingens TaxID=2606893 RepID=A0A5E8C1N4_9ASCO|nr:uncharacterized protein SAPINGB_P004779 [Saprochaete ingens]VVT55870.1 unnamed protein product [Saprochaete ingens]